jgi:outer membrane protein TolC
MMIYLILVLTLLSPMESHAAPAQSSTQTRSTENLKITKKLRELLNTPADYRGRVELSIQDVTLAAMKSSDSFRAVMAAAIELEANRLTPQSLTDTYLTLSANQQWNRNQPDNPFGTVRSDAFRIDAAAEKAFRSGTKLTLGLTEFKNNLVFGGTFGSTNAKVASLQAKVEQSLWRDFFGQSTRDRIQAGELLSKSDRLALEQKIESWFLDLAKIYHQAWLLQRRVDALKTNVERRSILAGLFQRRQALGISEEADRIQIEAALEQSKIQLAESERALDRIWKNLIITLKLPEEYREFNALEIPLRLDEVTAQEESQTEATCKTPSRFNRTAESTRLQKEALTLQRQAELDSLRPDLKLTANLLTNRALLNQRDDFGLRWTDTFGVQNPAWTVGLQLVWPLEASGTKAQAARIFAQSLRLDAISAQTESQTAVDFEATCAELQLQLQNLKLYRGLETRQKLRTQLEDKRYRQARSAPFNVLQAGDEWFGTTVATSQAQTEWWNQRYQLDAVRGELFTRLNGWVQAKTGKGLSDAIEESRIP